MTGVTLRLQASRRPMVIPSNALCPGPPSCVTDMDPAFYLGANPSLADSWTWQETGSSLSNLYLLVYQEHSKTFDLHRRLEP
jgi:hypothetical protein